MDPHDGYAGSPTASFLINGPTTGYIGFTADNTGDECSPDPSSVRPLTCDATNLCTADSVTLSPAGTFYVCYAAAQGGLFYRQQFPDLGALTLAGMCRCALLPVLAGLVHRILCKLWRGMR